MKLEFSLQIFEKYSNIKFHENPSSGSRVVARGLASERTDRHEETENVKSDGAKSNGELYGY